MKFDVLHRRSLAVLFTAEIACSGDALPGLKLGLAVKWALANKADLQFADLQSANLQSANLQFANLQSANLQSADLRAANLQFADLQSANLQSANLQFANLQSANLQSADLRAANLQFADLQSANLQSANLQSADLQFANLQFANLQFANLGEGQWIVFGVVRSDGYAFSLSHLKGEGLRVKAGCRNLTPSEAGKHWRATRGGTVLGAETFAICDHMWALAQARGYDLTS